MKIEKCAQKELYFGYSPQMEKVKRYINMAATSHCAVLLLGATGVGKGVFARWIHDHSLRKNGVFVDINCTSLKGGLFKSEVFGHTKGAFTGALSDHAGLIEVADGGTLFMDEIGDMDMDAQCQLLKVIEEKSFRRVGDNRLRTSDFRLICATNRNLPEAVESGAFREDLYYRINTLPINLPALEERRADIPEMLNYMLAAMGYDKLPLCEDVAEALVQHRWRGNVRELRNTLERVLAFAQGEALTLELVSDVMEMEEDISVSNEVCAYQAGYTELIKPQEINWNLDVMEGMCIRRAIRHFGGDKAKASAALGISLSCLYRKLKRMKKRSGNIAA